MLLTDDQKKVIKFYHDQESMHQLAFEDPNALVIYIDGVEAVISKEFGDQLDYGFTTAFDFLKWRLGKNDNNLNKLASELGYDKVGRVDRTDFIFDLIEYDENSLIDYIQDSYESMTAGDIYGGY